MDWQRVEDDWRQRGFSCDLWVDSPGQVWKDFVHAVDELVMVVEGDVLIELEGQIMRPVPGEEVFIPAGAVHTVRNCGVTRSRWFYGYRRR